MPFYHSFNPEILIPVDYDDSEPLGGIPVEYEIMLGKERKVPYHCLALIGVNGMVSGGAECIVEKCNACMAG